jgi:hypothetical protein
LFVEFIREWVVGLESAVQNSIKTYQIHIVS